jgi:hypothetical protein
VLALAGCWSCLVWFLSSGALGACEQRGDGGTDAVAIASWLVMVVLMLKGVWRVTLLGRCL